MTLHFNKTEMKDRRRELRANTTRSEELMWIFLRNRNTKRQKFRRQYSVDSYIIDFYCPSLKLALEIDGDIHDLEDQKKYDAERQKHIEAFGIRFLRIKNEDIINDMDRVMKKVEDIITSLLTEKETSP